MTQFIYQRPLKDTGIAYLCWLTTFIFVAGIQHFYLGRPVKGVIWLLTWGLLGVGTLIDLFTLPSQVRKINYQIQKGLR